MKSKTKKLRRGRAVGSIALLGRYRRAVKSLEKLKAKHFYHGTPVRVNCQRVLAGSCGRQPPERQYLALPARIGSAQRRNSATRHTGRLDCYVGIKPCGCTVAWVYDDLKVISLAFGPRWR